MEKLLQNQILQDQIESLQNQLETLFAELITHQQKKVLEIARTRLPHLTSEDILNPHDFPELNQDPIFNFEDGVAAGMLAAQMAIRARIFRNLDEI